MEQYKTYTNEQGYKIFELLEHDDFLSFMTGIKTNNKGYWNQRENLRKLNEFLIGNKGSAILVEYKGEQYPLYKIFR